MYIFREILGMEFRDDEVRSAGEVVRVVRWVGEGMPDLDLDLASFCPDPPSLSPQNSPVVYAVLCKASMDLMHARDERQRGKSADMIDKSQGFQGGE